MFKNIKNVLNNENGGPNLEHLLGIAVSAIALTGWVIAFSKMITKKFAPTMVENIAKMDASTL